MSSKIIFLFLSFILIEFSCKVKSIDLQPPPEGSSDQQKYDYWFLKVIEINLKYQKNVKEVPLQKTVPELMKLLQLVNDVNRCHDNFVKIQNESLQEKTLQLQKKAKAAISAIEYIEELKNKYSTSQSSALQQQGPRLSQQSSTLQQQSARPFANLDQAIQQHAQQQSVNQFLIQQQAAQTLRRNIAPPAEGIEQQTFNYWYQKSTESYAEHKNNLQHVTSFHFPNDASDVRVRLSNHIEKVQSDRDNVQSLYKAPLRQRILALKKMAMDTDMANNYIKSIRLKYSTPQSLAQQQQQGPRVFVQSSNSQQQLSPQLSRNLAQQQAQQAAAIQQQQQGLSESQRASTSQQQSPRTVGNLNQLIQLQAQQQVAQQSVAQQQLSSPPQTLQNLQQQQAAAVQQQSFQGPRNLQQPLPSPTQGSRNCNRPGNCRHF